MINVMYKNSCPNCGGDISADRLLNGLPCETCLPYINGIDGVDNISKVKALYNILLDNDKIKNYWNLYYNITTFETVFKYFKDKTGYEPWSLQKLWLRRLVSNQSFTMSAPTGLGKTTTLMTYSVFIGQDVVYIVPTKSLMEQVCKRLEKLGAQVSCGKVDQRKVSVITISYLNKNANSITSYKPNFVAIDDADAVIKSGKTTDRLVSLLGIPNDVYESAIQLIRLRNKYYFSNEFTEEIKEKIRELELKIAEFKDKISQLVIASATIRPKGIKQKALRLLTGFEPSSIQLYARNIIDTYTDNLDLSIVKELGSGGLILVSKEYGRSRLNEIKKYVEDLGFNAKLAISGRKFLDDFSQGKVDILVGSASYYGVAVRGIDEPKRLKYVIYYGVPKIKAKLFDALSNPFTLLRVGKMIGVNFSELQNKILVLSPSETQLLKFSIIKGETINYQKLDQLRQELLYYISLVKDKLKEIGEETLISDNFVITKQNTNYYIIYPDMITYLQGSGRASRLYNGGLTLGFSIILVDDKHIFEILKKKMQKLFPNTNFTSLSNINLSEIKTKLEESRKEEGNRVHFNISTGLLIVESPTKAKTIAKMFSRPSVRVINKVPVYETIIVDGNQIYVLDVVASKGHIVDLTLEDIGYYGIKVEDSGIIKPYYDLIKKCLDCNKTFSITSDKCPYCGSTNVQTAQTTINLLRELALSVDKVFIASDPDTEGEKIAYDLASFLSPYNSNVYRITYHEITKKAILEALRNPMKINTNLVMSQIVRRIEDRWIGFTLSNLLKTKFNGHNHGAGRVQTPVLGWIVDKTMKYKSSMGYVVYIDIAGYSIKMYFSERKKMEEYINNLQVVKIEKISEEKILLSPLPPFTTDTLLIEANMKYKLPANLVMKIAQDLFEAGLITYHRTDSTHISSVGIEIAKEYLQKQGLIKDFVPRSWESSEEGAHEAIRPTRAMDVNELIQEIEENPYKYSIRFSKLHFLIYDLIFRRFMASQMSHAVGTKSRYLIKLNKDDNINTELLSNAEGGFIKVYPVKVYNLPLGEVKPKVNTGKGSSEQLLSYSDVISLMKSKGIGRPSTYAKTIENLVRHGYIVSSKRKSYLIATNRGISAYQFLSSKFYDLVSEGTTAKLMSKLDDIALSKLSASTVLLEIFSEISTLVNPLKSEQNV
ncbi:reverse gyrase [Saccharolobus islandicus]|uniref:reverse gyrase n=1 Tax=Saccharolobus islandicus TaxID=43080 RepID=UPI0003716BDC|nr:reverse gyrase [Sulfolobus islandicus]